MSMDNSPEAAKQRREALEDIREADRLAGFCEHRLTSVYADNRGECVLCGKRWKNADEMWNEIEERARP
jgi:hypothetical protein